MVFHGARLLFLCNWDKAIEGTFFFFLDHFFKLMLCLKMACNSKAAGWLENGLKIENRGCYYNPYRLPLTS